MAMSLGPSGGGGRRGRSRAPIAEINVTPFVDVMLVLLIIFMVTAPLLVAGVPIDLPDSRAAALEQEKEPVQISLDAEGQPFIDDAQVAMADLPAALEAIRSERGEDDGTAPQVMLRADRSLDYGKVMLVMGELNRAGLNRVSLVTTGSSERP
ncbi:ExbD/TolR family protein [Blastomonas sp.]|uniref:ExbD/TolR family protein n=1 Tax=Blastomonas sp. TaxID=1909299 RepID=UPI0026251DC0|nr:ExbD/TolR family protein [Blastomonas sp.]MDM7956375.1 ExbD/TolR family protein [Blastomonas sp.]